MNNTEQLEFAIYFVVVSIVIVAIVVIFRMFFLWYWKVDKIVELLESIDSKLLVLKNNTTGDAVIEDNKAKK